MIKNIILDFDGTLTDAWKEGGEEFQNLYAKEFSEKTRVPIERLKTLSAILQVALKINPEEGWLVNGKVMAPAGADPYMLIAAVHKKAIEQLRHESNGYRMPKESETGNFLLDLFHSCSKNIKDCFRPGAREFLRDLSLQYRVAVITNSKTDKAQNKIQRLMGNDEIQVEGEARKHIPTDYPDCVPDEIHINGLKRPVYLRRGHYFDVLQNLSQKIFSPENTAVVGDIFELDIALPLFLGYKAILLDSERQRFLSYEREYVSSHQNGYVASSLEGVLDILKHF